MDTAARARQLALVGIEARATQSSGGGQTTGGKTAHEPAGSPKGGQFTSNPMGGGGYQSILPAASAYNSGGGGKKKAASAPANTPQAPTTPRTMKPGDSGEDVRYAQYAMNLLGFKMPQDGQYGPETEAAVKQIQERLGVKKPNGHLSASQLHKLQDAVRLSPCVGQGQRDLGLEADWEARDLEEVDDELDEDTEALIAALGEFIGSDERSFNEALHPRNPKGSAGGGRFRSITDRIVAALSDWKHGNGPDDPLKDFNRDQLLKAAKAHGHTFRRGASIEEIKAQILDDVRNGTKAEKAATPKLPGAPADHRRFTIQLGGKVDPAAVREVEVENKIRAAYVKHKLLGGYAPLADVRKELSDVPRAEQDAVLRKIATEPGTQIIPWDNTKALTSTDHEAALHFGGGPNHAVRFEDASPKPLPKPSGTATDVGIFAAPSTGKLSLYRESDTGKKQGRAIKSFDDMAGLEAWARDNGHTELADYAARERRAEAKRWPTTKEIKDAIQWDDESILNPAKAEQARTGGAAKVAKAAPAKAGRIDVTDLASGLGFGGGDSEIAKHDAGMLEAVQSALDGKREPALGVHREGQGTPASIGRALEQWANGAAGPYYKGAVTQGVGNDPEQKAKAAEFKAQGDRWVALAKKLQGTRRTSAPNKATPDLEQQAMPNADPLAGLEGLTTVQKRAALRKRGLSKAEIDALAPLGAKPATGAKLNQSEYDVLSVADHSGNGEVFGRKPAMASLESKGLIKTVNGRATITDAGRAAYAARPQASGFDPQGIAERISRRGGEKAPSVEAIQGDLAGLNVTQLRQVAKQFNLGKAPPPAGSSAQAWVDYLVAEMTGPQRFHWRALAAIGVTRALGHDVTPGHDELHHYWTRGPGLAKWAESPKPWTTLVAHLTKYVGPEKAKIYASRWFIEVFHFASGSDLNRVTHGKPPRGKRVGPG